jgi:prepilin-type N-terminal cleavage/methylation domain-containing protein/prepilin-type processing-associated H-X9-DG protein
MTRRRCILRNRGGLTLIEVVIVLAIYALLMALVLPAVMRVRALADRLNCAGRLRQAAMALHLYHQDYHDFPPGCTSDRPNQLYPHMTWMTRALPYLEQDALWNQALNAYAMALFVQAPPHQPILGKPLRLFACPADPRVGTPRAYREFSAGYTSYLGVLGTDYRTNDGVLFLDSHVAIDHIYDGASNTLLIGERPPSSDGHLGWWYAGWGQRKTGSLDSTLGVAERNDHQRYQGRCPPGPYSFETGRVADPCAMFHFWSLHPLGANFAFADGSARFLHYAAARPLMQALASRDGSDPVKIPD